MSIDKAVGTLSLFVLFASLVGCSGASMLEQKKAAPPLSARADGSVEAIDGKTINLRQLSAQGPVVLVFLRGFS